MSSPTALAQQAMNAFSDGNNATIPVDPVQIARSLGINVYSAKLENSLSGMITKLDPDGDVSIFLNSEHAPVRQRFTCAHELGHYFSNMQLPDAETRTYIHRRDSLSACGTHGEEIFANQFAAELLMPAEQVQSLFNMGFDPMRLAGRFHVSYDAMMNRLKNLRLV